MQPVEQHSEPAVGHRHLGRVEVLQAPQHRSLLARREPVVRARVVRHGRLGPAPVGVAVHAQVARRRRPGLVRLVGVDHQRERAAPGGLLEHGGGAREDARRERSSLVVPVAAVREIEADALALAAADGGVQPVPQHVVRDARHRPAAAELPARLLDAVEAAAQAGVGAGEAEEGVVGHVGGPPAGAAQQRGQRVRHVAQRRPARLGEQPRAVVPASEREGAAPAQDRVARRHGGHRLGVGAREAQPVAGERVDVRREHAAAVGADVIGAQRVDHDQQHVGALARGGEGARAAQRGAGGRGG